MRAPTGEQFRIIHRGASGANSAIITELAASLRELVIDGVESVQSHAEDVLAPMGSGLVLVPWPNRIADARYTLDGRVQQLDITEVATGNAIHGLLRNSPYRASQRTESSVTLNATVFPQHGYPFLLDTAVTYALDDDGLTVTHEIHNASDAAAPVAVGTHPYLRVGTVPTEQLVLRVDAATRFEVDARQIPTSEVPVDGTDFDLRHGRIVGELSLDHGFGGAGASARAAAADASGTPAGVGTVHSGTVHSVTAPDGSATELWADENFGFVQVYTPKAFPLEDGSVTAAVAIEPMTAPANAFNTGEGLRWLAPGETWVLSWGIRHREPAV